MSITRRGLIRGDVAAVTPGVAVGALNNRFAWAQAADFDSDVDVLNYALTLEYLEAEFYRQGNSAGLVSGKEQQYLAAVQADEDSHVATIMQTVKQIGGEPVAMPSVDFGGAFASRQAYLETSHTFENVGVQAYLGAAGFIKDKAILQAAAGIFGVEARHAAIVGNLLGLSAEDGVYMGATETPLTKTEVLAAVEPFLAGAGAMGDDAAVTL
ncbi:MAG: ferritin-like domain-containing protein [Nocardioidaceae bacterium]|nr:ferritin-like domain-containing protein [Nocardioidaceae bacterium]